jgi:hypothetical protein
MLGRTAPFERIDVLCLHPARSTGDEQRAHPRSRRKNEWGLNFGEAPEPADLESECQVWLRAEPSAARDPAHPKAMKM